MSLPFFLNYTLPDYAIIQAPMYQHLLDEDKQAFKESWFQKRDFEFTSVTRKVTKSYSSSSTDAGEFLNRAQLISYFGGGDAKSSQGATEADLYINNCIELDPTHMTSKNEMTGTDNYLLIRKLVNKKSKQEWLDEVLQRTEMNEWEDCDHN
jgi:hypothetical protein